MSKKSGGGWGINKFSFWLMAFSAILYLVAMILSVLNWNYGLVGSLQSIAAVIMICVVAVLAWRYVKNAGIAWKLLYVIFLLIIIVCLILPILKNFKLF